MSILISPHDDDSVLYAAFTCQRDHPTVVIVTDSHVQPARGETGCSAEERAAESEKAHEILGCHVHRLGLRDDALTKAQIVDALEKTLEKLDQANEKIYIPALEGGHPQHDLVSLAALEVFKPGYLRCYSTYSRHSRYFGPDLNPVGTTEIEWTRDEIVKKQRALACYHSQIRVNPQHFRAVDGGSEWLSGPGRLHLGCGEQIKRGWLNLDQSKPPTPCSSHEFAQADLCEGIPATSDSLDYVFSEDFLEHLPSSRRVDVLNEIWRVLVPGGVMEHYIPNAGSRNDFGSPTHLSHWNLQLFDHFDVDSKRWRQDRHFEGIRCGFKKIRAELLCTQTEDDGVARAQSIHVMYRAVKEPC